MRGATIAALCLLAAACLVVVKWNGPKIGYYFPLSPEQAPNHHKLVSPKWVAELIEGETPPTYEGRGFVLVEVNGPRDRGYARGHLPGALLLETGAIERAPMWNLVSDEELQAVIEGLGITRETTVVIYGRDSTAAARVIWALMFAGVADVRLLDGGFGAWKRYGGRVDRVSHRAASVEFGGEVPMRPEYRATREDVAAMMEDSKASWLVDVRSAAEFEGRTSGYDYISAKGRIPTAVWGGEASERTFRGLKSVPKRWQSFQDQPGRGLTFYCGTGWRSSLAFFYAHVFGFEKIRNYDGSWLEWSGG